MAVKLADLYQYFVAANAAYPGGSFKNASAPGASDGTPVEKVWLNDWLGFFSALMVEGAVAYSGAADTATASQYLQALHAIITASDVHKVDGFHASQTPGANTIPVLDANGNYHTANGDLVLWPTDAAGASTLPFSFNEGITTFQTATGGWPGTGGIYGHVVVVRHGTRVTQTFYPASSTSSYTRCAVSDTNVWSAWVSVWNSGMATSWGSDTNGGRKLPDGTILQWGKTVGTATNIVFPAAFPNAVNSLVVTPTAQRYVNVSALSLTGFTAHGWYHDFEAGMVDSYYLAIGR